MTSLQGKKLLILGSTTLISVIVSKAKEMGVYTIVTDNREYEKAPAKQIADKYYNLSFSDIDAMKELIKQEQIDGVLTGFTDSYMEYYLKICEETGLPCYGGYEQFMIATDKASFKKACLESEVPVIPGMDVKDIEQAKAAAEEIGYPVFLKPADNSGSRGVIKCETREELKEAFDYAYSFSACKTVILEKYMDCDNVAMSYFISDGYIKLSTLNDRYLYVAPDTGSSITSYAVYPSVYSNRYLEEADAKVKKMLLDHGFSDGMVSLQAFVDDNSFYFCEMCYRPSGGHHFYFIKDQNHIDQLELLIRFAVNGSCYDSWNHENENPMFAEKCGMLKIIGDPEKEIMAIEGMDEINKRSDVVQAYASKSVGDKLGKSGTTAQTIGTIWYKAESEEALKQKAELLLSMLKVIYTDGSHKTWIALN